MIISGKIGILPLYIKLQYDKTPTNIDCKGAVNYHTKPRY